MTPRREIDRLLLLAAAQNQVDLVSILRAPGAKLIALLDARVDQLSEDFPLAIKAVESGNNDFGSW